MKKVTILSAVFAIIATTGIFYDLFAQFDFTVTPTSGCIPLTVTVTNTTTDTNAYRYYWYFDDGSPSVMDTMTTTIMHTYTSSGNYSISMGVLDSLSYWLGSYYGSSGPINVSGSDYISVWPDSACPGDDFQFCGVWPGNSWNWQISDGYSSTNNCFNHSFAVTGDYSVSLIQTTSCGTDTVYDTVFVRTTIPSDANFSINSSPSCPNDMVNFYPYTGGGTHFWDFGDSVTSTLENPTHTFSDTGIFSVKHIRQNNCGNSDTVFKTITIDTTIFIPSGVYLNINDNPLCPNDRASFNTSGGYNSYLWSFGDGSPSLDTTVYYIDHYYSDTGDYIVSVTFANGCGNDTTLSDTVNIVNNLGFENFPWLSIYSNMSTFCPGDEVEFYTNWGFTQYVWNFGDGSPSENTGTNSNNRHTFSSYGNFNVSVTISNNCGIDTTITKTVSVVNNAPVVGNFNLSINSSPACPGQVVNMYTSYGYKQYSWNFGDGSPVMTGKYASIEHAYNDTGSYTVSVTISNSCGSDTIISGVVVINNNVGFPNQPWFQLNVDESPSCPGANIYFSAPQGYAYYLWNFGDSTPTIGSPLSSLNHKYDTAANYLVSVQITNQCGIDTTMSALVVVSDSAWFGNISPYASPSTACPDQTVNFSIQYGYYFYKWDFGDGTPPDTTTNTSWKNHAYSQPGTFTYTITITSYCGIDTVITGTINIDSTITIPAYADIDVNYTPACPGQEISFSADGGNKSYTWNFGDGSPLFESTGGWADYTYMNLGAYPVSLVITNYCGFDTTLLDTVNIISNAGFANNLMTSVWPEPVCPGDEVNLNTASGYASYDWDFGDSTFASGSPWANHAYDTAGTYYPTVTITNHCGIDTTLTFLVVVDANTPVPANLTLSTSTPMACAGDLVRFDVNGSNFVLYVWTFGDGDTSLTFSDEVVHAYDTAGVYNVSVTIFNGCGNYQTFYTGVIVDNNAPVPPGLTIFVPVSEACPGDEIQFIASGGSPSYTYIWNYGDGTVDTSDASNFHVYSDTGKFTISLTALNSCGNSYTTSVQFAVSDSIVPQMDDGDSWGTPSESNFGGCPGDAILFYFWGTGENFWDFGDGWTDVATEELVVEDGFVVTIIKHAYADTGTYNVKLTLTNGCGFSATDSMYLKVGSNLLVNGDLLVEEPVSQGGYTTCQPVKFLAIGGASCFWNFGDGDTLTTINPTTTHIYSTPGTYSVSVVITNGCGNSLTLTTMVTIYDVGSATVTTNILAPVTCNNGNNGSAEVTAVGGEPPFTYLWSDGAAQTSSTAVNLAPGSYYVTVSDNFGCSGIGTVTINNPAPITINVTDSLSACGGATGIAVASVTGGGTAPFTYLWSDGQTGQMAAGLGAGVYIVVVTDSNACVSSTPVTISDNGAPSVVINSISNVSCYNGSNGSISITVSGGTPSYTFIWSNGSTLEDPSSLASGTYNLTLTDAGGCKTAEFMTVYQPSVTTLAFSSVGTGCGTSNGSATVNASGGTGSYTYLWDNNTNDQTTQTATGLPYGTFDITVTDANGCPSVGTASVNNTNSPSISAVITDVSCYGGSNGSIIQTVTGGTTPYTYTWSVGGATKNKNNIPAATYTCFISDASGCVTIRNYTITQPAVLTASSSSTSATCGNADGTVSVTASGGTLPYTYAWSGGGAASTMTGRASGAYTVTVTDSKGCTVNSSTTVSVAALAPSICVVTVDSLTKKNLIAWEKTAGYGVEKFVVMKEVSLNDYDTIGFVPFDSLSSYIDFASDPKSKSDRYKLIAVDSCGNISAFSTAHKTIHLTASPGINDERNLSLTDGYEGFTFGQYRIWRGTAINNITLIDSIVSNATTYSDWDTLTGVDSLFYFVEVVHPTGCTSTLKLKTYNSSKSNTASLEAPASQLVSNTAVTDVTCNGGNNGSATSSVSGGTSPFTYIWNDPGSQTGSTATGLNAGTYYVTISDSQGATVTDTAVVTEPSAVLLTITETQDTCGSGDGTATASASGGNGGYTYSWSSGQNTNNATGLAAGTYSVTATDVSGCTGVNSTTISVLNISLAVSFTVADATCNNADGSLTAAASNGTGGYAYAWSNSQSAATATGLAAGTYSVTATDGNGCSGTSSSSVNSVNVLLTLLSTSSAVSCNGLSNGSATVLAASGTAPYTYQWEAAANNQTNATATALAAGSFDVTVTDSEGCYNSQGVTVTEPALIVLSVSVVNSTCSNADGSAIVTASGGVGGFTYSWSNGQTASTATGLAAGNYSVTVTDGNNCTKSTVASVSDANAPSLAVSTTDVTCFGDGDGMAYVSATGGTPPYTYQWDSAANNQTDSIATALSGGTYFVSVYDSAGCLSTQSATVTEPAQLVLTATVTDANAPGNNDGAIDLTVTGGTGAYTFAWSNSEITEDLTGLSSGTYTVTVTDANGCQEVYTDTVKLIVDGNYRIPATEYRLHVYPNPFKDETKIQYQLPFDSKVSLALFSLLGEKIILLSEENQDSGVHFYTINSVQYGLTSGIFMIKLTVNGFETNLMILQTNR